MILLDLSTVKISAKSETSIEQRYTDIGRGFGAMPPRCEIHRQHWRTYIFLLSFDAKVKSKNRVGKCVYFDFFVIFYH